MGKGTRRSDTCATWSSLDQMDESKSRVFQGRSEGDTWISTQGHSEQDQKGARDDTIHERLASIESDRVLHTTDLAQEYNEICNTI